MVVVRLQKLFLKERLLVLDVKHSNESSDSLGSGVHRRILLGHGRRSAGRSAKFLHERSISGLLASHPRPAERLSLPAR